MADSSKPGATAEAAVAPTPGDYRLKGLGKQKEVHVPVTNRSYVLANMTQDQLKQLHELGWPHVEQVPSPS